MRLLRSSLLKSIALMLFVCVGIFSTNPSRADQLSNINGVHDPSRMVFDPVSNRWIVWWTGNNIPFATSPDKVNWTTSAANVVVPINDPQPQNYWAPDMWDAPIHGKYYLFYALSSFGSQNSAIKVASTTSLTNPVWMFEGNAVTSVTGDPFNAIDPCPFYDAESDRLWLVFGSFWTGMYIVELDSHNPAQAISGFTQLAGGRFNGSHPTSPGGLAGKNAMEGPYVFYRNGWYYLNVSVDSCCRGSSSTYKMIIGRSRDITGPYVDRDGVDLRFNGGTIFMAGSGPEIGPGQFAVYELNGEPRFSYHFYLTNGQSRHGGRRMEWGADDWPKAVFPQTVPRGIYRLRKNTNLHLAVRNESTNPLTEAHIEQDSTVGRPSQNWLFVPTTSPGGDTYYTIQNVATGFYLDVTDGHREEGDFIRQWFLMDPENNESQRWRVIAVGDTAGSYQIQSVRSGRVLGVAPTSTADFSTVTQRDWQFTSGTFRDSNGNTTPTVQTDLKFILEPVNNAPVAANKTATTDEDTAATITLSASDVDSPSLSFSIVAGPSHGTLGAVSSSSCTASGAGSSCTATVTYTPAVNYNGPDSFTYKANDGSADSNVATVSITVIPNPTVESEGKVTGGGEINVPGGAANFGLNAKRDVTGGPVSGQLEYYNHARTLNVHSTAITALTISDNTARFAGTCTKNGVSCTFTVTVEDNGEPGSGFDEFTIAVSGEPVEGGQIVSGNVQIH